MDEAIFPRAASISMLQLLFVSGLHSTVSGASRAPPRTCCSTAHLMSASGSTWPSRLRCVTSTKFIRHRSHHWWTPLYLWRSSQNSLAFAIFSDPSSGRTHLQGVIRARCLRNILSLLRIARRIVTSVFPANVLSSLLVCRLLLSLFVPHDALLG